MHTLATPVTLMAIARRVKKAFSLPKREMSHRRPSARLVSSFAMSAPLIPAARNAGWAADGSSSPATPRIPIPANHATTSSVTSATRINSTAENAGLTLLRSRRTSGSPSYKNTRTTAASALPTATSATLITASLAIPTTTSTFSGLARSAALNA